MAIPFSERISLLNGMMEKLFVIREGSIYHMKVGSDAVPINIWRQEQAKETLLKNPREKQAQAAGDGIAAAQRIREIQDEK
jgi:hypothetical protein